MSDTGWTTGPWEVAYLDKHAQRVVKNQHIEICTCWHHSVGSIEKEMEANAHLIAAAPTLYEALAAITDAMPAERADTKKIHDLIVKGEAVLAKARGEQP